MKTSPGRTVSTRMCDRPRSQQICGALHGFFTPGRRLWPPSPGEETTTTAVKTGMAERGASWSSRRLPRANGRRLYDSSSSRGIQSVADGMYISACFVGLAVFKCVRSGTDTQRNALDHALSRYNHLLHLPSSLTATYTKNESITAKGTVSAPV